jgi:hypothetical protein
MTFSRGAQRAILAIFIAFLSIVYAIAWLAPAIGLLRDDAFNLVTAKAIATGHGYTIESLPTPILETRYPPFFAAVLALFVLISQQPLWLKLLPFVCTAGWLVLTFKLLLKMGASRYGALLIALLTAASPAVVLLSTNLLSESLFALLITAALLMMLDDHALAAGILAGLATLTQSAGVPLIAACILTFTMRRRFRSAVIFAAAAMVIFAPWFGWALAHATSDIYRVSNILTSLPANEKLVVLTRNFVLLLASPFSLLTGIDSMYAVIGTAIIGFFCLYKRRQLVPDLFIALYCLMLLCRTWPPERFVAPVLPLILWIIWRVVSRARLREAVAACVIILGGLAGWADARRIRTTLAVGVFPTGTSASDNWRDMLNVFRYIRANTPQNSVVMANLDPLVFLNTGRRAVRGFAPDRFDLHYAPRQSAVTPDQLSTAIRDGQVDYVMLSPDRDFAESASFHKSIEALERGGLLQPVAMAGIPVDYRLLQVTR